MNEANSDEVSKWDKDWKDGWAINFFDPNKTWPVLFEYKTYLLHYDKEVYEKYTWSSCHRSLNISFKYIVKAYNLTLNVIIFFIEMVNKLPFNIA